MQPRHPNLTTKNSSGQLVEFCLAVRLIVTAGQLARLTQRHKPVEEIRKLKIMEHISLDGVIQISAGPKTDSDFPYGDWTAPIAALPGSR